MRSPDRVAYLDAMQSMRTAFGHLMEPPLRQGVVQRNALGLPSTANGAFAITFDVAVSGRRYAVRCFTNYGQDLAERYAAISRFTRSARLDFLVEVDFLARGINVDGALWPTLAMPWIDGICLNDWIDAHLRDGAALERLRTALADAVGALRKASAAHGDLQHGNILVQSDNRIKLIDYDGMFLPALASLGASERGNRHYQHPLRDKQFDASLDSFAAHVIDLSIHATAEQPKLWTEFNVGDNLLFTAADLADPTRSGLFARLAAIPRLAASAQRLRLACLSPPEQASGILDGTITPAIKVSAAAAARPETPTQPIVSATERGALLQLAGEEVTVIGKVMSVKSLPTRMGGTFSLINFGDYRAGAFTLVLWERTRIDVVRNLGDPELLAGAHVSVTGRITVFTPKSGRLTPQIELRHARTLRKVSAAEAAVLLKQAAAASARPAKPAPLPPKPFPSPIQVQAQMGTPGLSSRLGALYSSAKFQAKVKPTGTPTMTPHPAPQHPSPPRQAPPSSAPPPTRPAPPPTVSRPPSVPPPTFASPPAWRSSSQPPSSSYTRRLPGWWARLLRAGRFSLDEWSGFGLAFTAGSFVVTIMACCGNGLLGRICSVAAMVAAAIGLLYSIGTILAAPPGLGKPWYIVTAWISTAVGVLSGGVSLLLFFAALLM